MMQTATEQIAEILEQRRVSVERAQERGQNIDHEFDISGSAFADALMVLAQRLDALEARAEGR